MKAYFILILVIVLLLVSGLGLLIVDTSRTVAAVGFVAGRELDFDDVVIELNDTVLDRFAVVSLTVIDGETSQAA